jgi:ankyrin repeat protein
MNKMPKHTAKLALIALLSMPAMIVSASDSPLADAAQRQQSDLVGRLLEQSSDVDAPQVDAMTALHWAVYHADVAMAKLLVDAGANTNAANRYGVTPLSLACLSGEPAVVEMLLDAGADPTVNLPGGETTLMTAARTGRLGPVRALLDRGVDVDASLPGGQTALMWAAAEGHVEVVDALIEAGADFRAQTATGFTPLFFAVREGRIDVVRRLIAAGVDINDGMQPKKRVRKGPAEGISPLILAVENGHFELAVVLLQAGADANDQRSGYTPLHTLTWVRKPKRGDDDDGDPSPIGSGKLTSLQFVTELARFDVDFNARLKRGPAGRGRLSKVGATPFLMACETADLPLLQLLVQHGADPSIANVDHCTPLMAAAGIGQDGRGEEAATEDEALQVVEYLLALGADVNAVDQHGQTAMHGAAYKSVPRIVHLLAQRGADVAIWNRANRFGWTPLHLAHGFRPGNFKPSPETIEALEQVMLAAGITPPEKLAPPAAPDQYAN